MKSYTNRESRVDKDFDDVQQILESPILSDPEAMFKSLNHDSTYLTTLKRLVKKICRKVEMNNHLRNQIGEEIKRTYEEILLIEKTLSGAVSISEAGFQPMQEVYAANPKDTKTVDDALIILSMKN